MARYQIILAYDGTQFEGFQRQRRKINAARTVQAVVEEALRQLGWQGDTILAAGRTDTGVHASGQVIAFDLDWRHPAETLLIALNANLPVDVAVRAVKVVRADFHPRYDAIARRYRYTIFCLPVRDPLQERFAWRVWPAVALEPLNGLASQLVGTHDFCAFGAPPRGVGSTIRSVYRAGWNSDQGRLIFEIEANAFLYRMVRRVVFVQVMIAQGRVPPDAIELRISGKLAEMVQGLAPPQGLTLAEVKYNE